jgi:hypothetical protein
MDNSFMIVTILLTRVGRTEKPQSLKGRDSALSAGLGLIRK